MHLSVRTATMEVRAGYVYDEITLLHVIHDVSADMTGKYRDSLVDGVRKRLNDAVPAEAANWRRIVTRVATGVPYRIILRTIEDEKIDLLVMNIHGKGMPDRALLGSTAERGLVGKLVAA